MSDAALIGLILGGLLFLGTLLAVLRSDSRQPSDPPPITDDNERQAWLQRAQTTLPDFGLEGTREVAGKWAASAGLLAGALSSVAVVAGPSDLAKEVGGTEAQVAAGLILLAGGLAVIAMLLGGLAQQGTPVVTASDDAALYREIVRTRAQRARRQLTWSRALIVVAVALSVGAAGVAWLTALTGPEKTAGQSALVTTDLGARCGTLANAGTTVVLSQSGGAKVVIPAGAEVTLVDSCP